MATLDITEYGKSSAVLKSKWISDLRARFSSDRGNVTPSPLNAGIIGYSLDIMANAVEDAYFDLNTRSKEIFATVAKFDDSVYLHASSVNISNFFATPAYIEILVGIKESEILSRAVDRPGLNYKMLSLSGKTQVVLDGNFYLIDYPIDIVVKQGTNGRKLISSKYNLGTDNRFSDIESTYIHGKMQIVDNVNYYVLKTKARQLVCGSQTFTFNSSSVGSDTYTIGYDLQLAGFEVYYQENDDANWVLLENIYSGILTGVAGKKFCYYRLLDGEFEISFSNNPKHFKPAFNSKLRVDTYITGGTEGNFKYTAEQTYLVLQQDNSDVYQEAFAGIVPACQMLYSESKGGVDKPSLDDIRAAIVEKKSCRNTIISETDLKAMFTAYNINVQKQRDDIYMRSFMTFVLLQDNDSDYILPTRTGELFIKEADTMNQPEVDARIVSPDSVYNFWLADELESFNTKRFMIAGLDDTNMSPTVALENENWLYLYNKYIKYNGVLMMCPFIVKIFKDPYFVALYDVQCNETIGTVFGYNNYNSPEKFSVNGISIYREDVRSKSYKISCEVAVSDIVLQEFQSAVSLDDFSVRVKVEMLDSNDQTYAYITLANAQLNADGTKLIFFETIETDNLLHNDDLIRIINKKITPTNDDVYTELNETPQKYFIPFKSKLRVYIIYRPDTYFESAFNNYMLHPIDIDGGYVVTDMFETNQPFQFVRDVSTVFSTVLEVQMTSGVYPKYTDNVPMVYDKPVYRVNEDGTLVIDAATGYPVVIHNVGDPVLDAGTGLPIYIHQAGDEKIVFNSNDEPIYEINPIRTFIVKNIPLVSMMAMLNTTYKKIIYETFKELSDTIQKKILSRVVENNTVQIGVFNTIGPSDTFVTGSKTNFNQLENLDVSIELNVRLITNDNADTIREDIKETVRLFMISVMVKGYFYMNELLTLLQTTYSDIEYVEFSNINDENAATQTIKVNPEIDSTVLVPEYISIGQILDEAAFKKDGTVIFTPNIVINLI